MYRYAFDDHYFFAATIISDHYLFEATMILLVLHIVFSFRFILVYGVSIVLFQDLPNYAQHTVPIFSLPQEWLWCESWCGNATKAKARTIDLCNNPMTKEPKLQGARRIVAEWPDLDLEARKFTAKILGEDVELNEPVQVATTDKPDLPPPSNDISEGSEQDLESKAEL